MSLFNSETLVTWNDITTKYLVAYILALPGDAIHAATREECDHYFEVNNRLY